MYQALSLILFFPFQILYFFVSGGREELKGEATTTLPNVPIPKDGELSPSINPEFQYNACSEGSD